MNRLVLSLTLVCSVSLHAEEPKRDRFGDPLPAGAVARLGTVHSHPYASTVAFSGDGKTILTTSGALVRYWDATTGRVLRSKTYASETEEVRQVVAADGRLGATVFGDRVEVHDVEQNKRLHRIAIPRLKELSNHGLGTPPLGMLAIASNSDVVFLRIEGANETMVFRGGTRETWPDLYGAADEPVFSADGRWVAVRTCGEDQPRSPKRPPLTGKGEILVRQLAAGGKVTTFAHDGPVHAVSPDGSLVVVRDDQIRWFGPRVRLLEARTGRRVPDGELAVAGASQAACFSRDGRLIAVATDKETSLWDIATKRLRWKQPGSASALAFSPDGSLLAGVDNVLRIWDVKAGKSIGIDHGPLPTGLQFGSERAGRVVMHAGRQVQVWDWIGGRPLFTTAFRGHEDWAAAWLSADGARLTTCEPRIVRTWEIATGKLLREFDPLPPGLPADKWQSTGGTAMPTPDGSAFSILFAEGSNDEARTRCVFLHYDLNSGKLLDRRDFTFAPFRWAGVGADPWVIWIYEGNSDNSRLIDVRTGRERPQITLSAEPGHRAYGPFAESRGAHITLFQVQSNSSDAPPETVVVETASQRPLLRIPAVMNRVERGNSVSFSYDDLGKALSPNGRWLAISRRSGIEIWDVIEQKKAVSQPADGLTRTTWDDFTFLSDEHFLVQYCEMTAIVWQLPATVRMPPTVRLSATTWDDLASDQPLAGQLAVWALKNDPQAGLEILRRVRSVGTADPKVVADLYADLGSSRFAVREAAMKRLRELGRTAETFLSAAKATSPEQTWRARGLLDALRVPGPSTPDERRAARAVQAAELMGGGAAKALLADWANGDPNAVLTREAKSALARWDAK